MIDCQATVKKVLDLEMFTEKQCCGSVNPNYGSGSNLNIFMGFLNFENQRYRNLLRLGLLFYSDWYMFKTKIVPYRTVPVLYRSVLRIRDSVPFWYLDPRGVKKSGSGSGMNNPDHISESSDSLVRIRIRDKHLGSGIKIPGSATMVQVPKYITNPI